MTKDCETCGDEFEIVQGRGMHNRITCYKCTNNNKKLTYRNKHLKKKYGITQFQFLKLVESQNDKCAICDSKLNIESGTPSKGIKRNGLDACIDHCHKTNKVRGILCFHCNTALGHLFDNVDLLNRIRKYLNP